jgi:regulator of chromosome condensation (RCC1) repeat-containing protein
MGAVAVIKCLTRTRIWHEDLSRWRRWPPAPRRRRAHTVHHGRSVRSRIGPSRVTDDGISSLCARHSADMSLESRNRWCLLVGSLRGHGAVSGVSKRIAPMAAVATLLAAMLPASPVRADDPASAALVQVVAGGFHVCGIGADANAYCWGTGGSGQLGNGDTADWAIPVPVDAPPAVKFTQLALGGSHTCALGDDRRLTAGHRARSAAEARVRRCCPRAVP